MFWARFVFFFRTNGCHLTSLCEMEAKVDWIHLLFQFLEIRDIKYAKESRKFIIFKLEAALASSYHIAVPAHSRTFVIQRKHERYKWGTTSGAAIKNIYVEDALGFQQVQMQFPLKYVGCQPIDLFRVRKYIFFLSHSSVCSSYRNHDTLRDGKARVLLNLSRIILIDCVNAKCVCIAHRIQFPLKKHVPNISETLKQNFRANY